MKAARAYANARMRAWKSRLLTRADAMPLFLASDADQLQRARTALRVEDPFARLIRIYEIAIRVYRAPLFRALLRLHEIENVKLLRRPRARGALPRLWLDLGSLATVSRSGELERTPYADIAATITRAHGDDLAAAELAFDRWASRQLLDEARRLPKKESLARQLIELVVRERDDEIVRRGAKWYGLTSVEEHRARDVTALRRERLRLCDRAFIGSPFLLAPGVAVVLLAEEEVRATRALIERAGDSSLDEVAARAMSASQLGA